jgi:hypothetical protein
MIGSEADRLEQVNQGVVEALALHQDPTQNHPAGCEIGVGQHSELRHPKRTFNLPKFEVAIGQGRENA